MQFLLALARGTYALPLGTVRKARRYACNEDRDYSTASPAAPNGSDDSGAANGGSKLSKTPFAKRLKFAEELTCNMQWHYSDRAVSPCA